MPDAGQAGVRGRYMQKDNFSYLLVALLLFIIGVPITLDLDLISLPVSRMLGIICLLAVGIWSLRSAGRLFHVGMFVAIVGIVLSSLSIARGDETLFIYSTMVLFVFLVLAAFSAMRDVAVGNDINPNRIIGAICIYLLLGVIWSILYAFIEILQPGSFHGLADPIAEPWNRDWVYYSFVTLTTLGYGDITPVSQTAKSLSLSEAIVGQFYIAVLVAGLVSAYISAKQSGGGDD